MNWRLDSINFPLFNYHYNHHTGNVKIIKGQIMTKGDYHIMNETQKNINTDVFGSDEALSWTNAIFDLPISSGQKLILAVLATFADGNDNQVFPSTDTMARKSELSRATVFRHLKALRQAGYIIQTGRVSTYNRTWRYRIEVEKIIADARYNSVKSAP